MELQTKIWMTGAMEWFAYLDEEEVYLGGREVPYPLQDGDRWRNRFGVTFEVLRGKIRVVDKGEPPENHW